MTASGDPAAPPELSPDLVFDILSNTRRRMVLYYLRQYGGEATAQELAEEIAALEYGVDVADLTRQQRKRVYVSLYQTHLPKLEECGISEYDDDREVVRLTDRATQLDSYLTSPDADTYPWQLHYLGLAVLGGVVLILSAVGAAGFGAIPSVGIGLLLTAGVAGSAIVQCWRHKQRRESLPAELLVHD